VAVELGVAHFPAPRDIRCWMKFTRRSSQAGRLRLTTRYLTQSGASRLGALWMWLRGGDPHAKRK